MWDKVGLISGIIMIVRQSCHFIVTCSNMMIIFITAVIGLQTTQAWSFFRSPGHPKPQQRSSFSLLGILKYRVTSWRSRGRETGSFPGFLTEIEDWNTRMMDDPRIGLSIKRDWDHWGKLMTHWKIVYYIWCSLEDLTLLTVEDQDNQEGKFLYNIHHDQ